MEFKLIGKTKAFGFDVISNGKEFYVVNEANWNGVGYSDCWRCENELGHYNEEFDARSYEIKPIYQEVDEDEFEIIGYEII